MQNIASYTTMKFLPLHLMVATVAKQPYCCGNNHMLMWIVDMAIEH